jgi:hypothetical protein
MRESVAASCTSVSRLTQLAARFEKGSKSGQIGTRMGKPRRSGNLTLHYCASARTLIAPQASAQGIAELTVR